MSGLSARNDSFQERPVKSLTKGSRQSVSHLTYEYRHDGRKHDAYGDDDDHDDHDDGDDDKP